MVLAASTCLDEPVDCRCGIHKSDDSLREQLNGLDPNLLPSVNVVENRPFHVPNSVIEEWLVTSVNLNSAAENADILEAYAICTKGATTPSFNP